MFNKKQKKLKILEFCFDSGQLFQYKCINNCGLIQFKFEIVESQRKS